MVLFLHLQMLMSDRHATEMRVHIVSPAIAALDMHLDQVSRRKRLDPQHAASCCGALVLVDAHFDNIILIVKLRERHESQRICQPDFS